jgi:hypothetical protein
MTEKEIAKKFRTEKMLKFLLLTFFFAESIEKLYVTLSLKNEVIL